MKKKSLFILLLIMALTASVFMTACGKSGKGGSKTSEPETLEEYAVNNPDVQKSIDEATSESDVEVEIKDNDVIYSFELSKMEGYTEDVAKDQTVIDNLQKALDNAGPTFGGIAKTLEEATGIKGIRVIVRYTFDGEELATQTFDASDAAAEEASEESTDESSDEEGDAEESPAEDTGDSEETAE